MIGQGVVAALLVLGYAATAAALDHKNLDAGRPLRVEDAYTISTGEIALEAGAGFSLDRHDARGRFPVELLWGAVPNLQLGVGSTLLTDPRSVEEPARSGDLTLSGLYNLNQETLWVPAFGAKLEVELPTGVRSSGVDVELKGIVTKSIGRLGVHLNAAGLFTGDPGDDERGARWEVVLGASYPIGAPHYTRLTVVADLIAEQAHRHGDSDVVGAEIGVRYQLTSRTVWDVGIGTEFAGPVDRTRLLFTTGLSVGF